MTAAQDPITAADIMPLADYGRAARPSGASASSEVKKQRRVEVGPVRDLLLRELRHHAAPGPGDALHREGRRRAARRRARRLQPADPAGQRAGRDGDVRDRGPGAPRRECWRGSAASRTTSSSGSAATRFAACRRTTRAHPRGRQDLVGALHALSLHRRPDRGVPRAAPATSWSASTIPNTATWR